MALKCVVGGCRNSCGGVLDANLKHVHNNFSVLICEERGRLFKNCGCSESRLGGDGMASGC